MLLVTGSILPVLVLFAFYDFVSTAKQQEDDARAAALRSEIAQFALYLGSDDGTIALDNAEILSKQSRNLRPVAVRKPFFTYFLNRANGNSFDPSRLTWEIPGGCAINFPLSEADGVRVPKSAVIRVCLAHVPNEATGRYVYLALKFPTAKPIVRHIQGKPLEAADRIELTFSTGRSRKMRLVFEPTTLASKRYPSQKRRFSAVHSVTAYEMDGSGIPLRGVNGQAFEQDKLDELGREQRVTTILVRIEESLITAANSSRSVSVSGLSQLKTSIVAYTPEGLGDTTSRRAFRIGSDTVGVGGTSLEKLYNVSIRSRAKLRIISAEEPSRIIWTSDVLDSRRWREDRSWIQFASNQWVAFIGRFFGFNVVSARAEQVLPARNVVVTLEGETSVLPEIATRAFLFLSLTLALVFLLTISGGIVIQQFRKISRVAYLITTNPSSNASLGEYRKRTDEIGAFGRTFDLLIRRHRARNARAITRAQLEAKEQHDSARIEREQVKTRQAILDAIGHEIRSPLNNLRSRVLEPEVERDLSRMERAVNALYFANSVESGLRNGKYVIARADLACFLSEFVNNMSEGLAGLVYDGPTSGVVIAFDDLILTQVMEHLCDNASRYRSLNTEINIRLERSDGNVRIEVENVGPRIPDDRLESIFALGFSSEDVDRNRGIGLFAARIYVSAMKGSISTVNRLNGVSFLIDFSAT